jgi:aldehyde dehydrogenase (NAD+)
MSMAADRRPEVARVQGSRSPGAPPGKSVIERIVGDGPVDGAGSGAQTWGGGPPLHLRSPIDLKELAVVRSASLADYGEIVDRAVSAFAVWRMVPAPKRGEVVRQIGTVLRWHKRDLADILTREVGKVRAEAEGEVQEMIDMADFAVGLSRMLYGATMPSERPGYRIYEQWHPLGPVGVITSFNFPLAVWSWNAFIALVCGDTVVWKPSSKAALSAVAAMKLIWPVLKSNDLPDGILNLAVGPGPAIGDAMTHDRRIPLVSATGSVRMGRKVAAAVGARLGRTILELGGNNAVIVTPSADLDLAVRAAVFGAVGTAGQRCTTIRRALVHTDVFDGFSTALAGAYERIRIGNPVEAGVHMGPLIDARAVESMQAAIEQLKQQGGKVVYGGEVLAGGPFDTGTYVRPCIAEARPDMPIVHEETFAPILYLMRFRTLEEAVAAHNAVPQGLSSAVFTNHLLEAELFLGAAGSDCGIANVNTGPSGAEIGGAFGGEKDSGGGREAGSDAWKTYMRRQTVTVNGSGKLPLAQGIEFRLV